MPDVGDGYPRLLDEVRGANYGPDEKNCKVSLPELSIANAAVKCSPEILNVAAKLDTAAAVFNCAFEIASAIGAAEFEIEFPLSVGPDAVSGQLA